MTGEARDANTIATRPTEGVIARAQLTRSISFCDLGAFDALCQRSVADTEWFTKQALRFLDHTHCGFPVKSAQDMCFGVDAG